MDPKVAILSEVAPLASGQILLDDVAEMSMVEAVYAFHAVDQLGKALEVRREQLREFLLNQAKASGEATEGGGQSLEVHGSTVLRERRQNQSPDAEMLKAVLQADGIEVEACFDEVKSLQFNPSKLKFMIDTGKIDPAKVEPLKKVSWAIRVTPSDELKKLMKHAASPPKAERLPKKTKK